MIAYLSGAMEQAPKEGQEWRSKITDWLKYILQSDFMLIIPPSYNIR